ncbi:MAG: potassium transporter [Proteobacteria bacterium]|nr:potassium transporter [Pseudomonadota bacterium]
MIKINYLRKKNLLEVGAIFRMIGLLLLIFSLSLIPPMAVYGWYRQGSLYPFLICFILTLTIGFSLWLPTKKIPAVLKGRDGFLVVVVVWVIACILGAMPFYFYFYPKLSFTDAVFESVSGLSTTGATVFSHLDSMPHSILYYRQQLTLLGGVGVIVIALAILPVLGLGGMQLYIAETSGPIKTTRLRPRLKQTAKSLWLIYSGLVVCCSLAYWFAGMPLFDAIGQSFSAVATAGFSVHDANIAYYHNHTIEVITIVFMILGSTNFGLHYQFFKQKKFSVYWRDPEWMTYLKIIVVLFLITLLALLIDRKFHLWTETIAPAAFTVATFITTTGFSTIDINHLPTFLPYLLFLSCIIGGCAGSTSGGIKVIRLLILKRQGARELKKLVHPNGVFPFLLGNEPLSEKVIEGIFGFVVIYITFLLLAILGLLAAGMDIASAIGSAAGCLTNTGLGFGQTLINFENINNTCKWILILSMLAGRLEVLTLLVLFTRAYWQR